MPGRGRKRHDVPAHGSTAARTGGFTLPELVVVLLLFGLVTALAIPNLERLSASITGKTERDRILDQFAGLGRQAFLQGRSYVVFGTGGAREAEPSAPVQEPADAAPRRPSVRATGHRSGPTSHAGHERYVIDLPEGWEIRLDPPLVVHANGVCLGAELTLRHRGAVDFQVVLEPPYCRIDTDVRTDA